MKRFTYLVMFVIFAPLIRAESPNELAIKIIRSQSAFGYNPRNNSKDELAHAKAVNSAMTLNALMANDKNVSEELRICYAIKLLDNALGIRKAIRSGSKPLPEEERIMKQRLILGARLIEIDKAEQDAAGQSATAE